MSEMLCVQIAALGGQGGGVLADWLAEAAFIESYPAQSTSIPGVAQRTGATTYYFELYPHRHCEKPPVFCLFPDSGDLDLMVAMEPLEAIRAFQAGLIGPKTTVITAIARIFSMQEKSVAGDGRADIDSMLDAVEKHCKRLIRLDIDALESYPGRPANALFFGAIQATGILPLADTSCQQAINNKGVAIKSNQNEFIIGRHVLDEPAVSSTDPASAGSDLEYAPCPALFKAEYDRFPSPIRQLIGHCLHELTHYQDEDYARLFLKRLQPFFESDGNASPSLLLEIARQLAAWMCFEDVIRVAQLKIRPGRLQQIRQSMGFSADDPIKVSEFLKPGREEFAGLLPPFLGRRLHSRAETQDSGFKIRLTSNSVSGYLLLKLMATIKPWRRHSYRFSQEHEAMEFWLEQLLVAREIDEAITMNVAKSARLIRGYGDVRRLGMTKLREFFDQWQAQLRSDADTAGKSLASLLQ